MINQFFEFNFLFHSHGSRPPWRNDYNDNRNRAEYSDRYPHDKHPRRDDPKRHDDGFRNRHEHPRHQSQRPLQPNSGKDSYTSKHPGDNRHGTINRHDGSYSAKDRHDSSHHSSINKPDVVSPHYSSMNRHEDVSPTHYGAKNRHGNRSDSDHR